MNYSLNQEFTSFKTNSLSLINVTMFFHDKLKN